MNIYLFSKLVNGKELSKPKCKGRNHKEKIDLIIKIFKHLCVKEKKKTIFPFTCLDITSSVALRGYSL